MEDLTPYISNPEALDRYTVGRERVVALLNRGVILPCPGAVEIGPEVQPERIAPGVVLHAGTRLFGARTLLAPGVEIGREGPCLLEDTVAGHGARLDGGAFTQVTFLDGAEARSWSHMRRGTLLEEKASVAHCVGLKQTILFPFVTLGSLINFCDVLMAGGTGPKDHSEVGSGYIHFNFTPRGDKATASLYGDVPRGVFIREPRIFLGGLGATVGPMTVGYGAFLGPGEVFRRDVKAGRFTLGEKRIDLQMDFDAIAQTGVRGKIKKNLRFIGQLVALWQWYDQIRPLFIGGDAWRARVLDGGKQSVRWAIEERVHQLGRLVELLPASIERHRAQGAERPAAEQEALVAAWPELQASLMSYSLRGCPGQDLDALKDALVRGGASDYIEAVQTLPEEAVLAGQAWLTCVVKESIAHAEATL